MGRGYWGQNWLGAMVLVPQVTFGEELLGAILAGGNTGSGQHWLVATVSFGAGLLGSILARGNTGSG